MKTQRTIIAEGMLYVIIALNPLTTSNASSKISEPSPRVQRENGPNNQHIVTMPIAKRQIPNLSDSDKLRFWKNVKPMQPEECWNWTGMKDLRGYGVLSVGGQLFGAHRISMVLNGISLAGGLNVCHKCDNPSCVNPGHLFTGTHADNMRDMCKKGRLVAPRGDAHGSRLHPESRPRGDMHHSKTKPWTIPRGEDSWTAKLTGVIVSEMRIRFMNGETPSALGREFGVSAVAATNAIKRRTWVHIT